MRARTSTREPATPETALPSPQAPPAAATPVPRAPAQTVTVRTGLSDGRLAGALEHVSFPELLNDLHVRGATGVLELRSGKKRKLVALRGGDPIAVKSNLQNECFGNLLVRNGRITQAAMDESLSRSRRGEGRQGEILVAMDAIEGEEISWALRMQADERFFEIFEWRDGHYRFHPRTRLAAGSKLAGGRTLANRLLEGVRTRAPRSRVEAFFCAEGARGVRLSPTSRHALRDLDVASQRDVLQDLDGSQSLVRAAGDEADARRTFYALCLLGVLELADILAREPDEIRERGSVVERARATVAAVAARAAESPEPAPTSPECEEEGERHFQRGLAELRVRNNVSAAARFHDAVRLEPGNGEYQSHLGWALYLENPDDSSKRDQALQHMRKGAKLAPDLAKPYLFLGRAYKAMGRANLAHRLFTRACDNEPECMEAVRELRLLNMRREKKGLIGRLFRRS